MSQNLQAAIICLGGAIIAPIIQLSSSRTGDGLSGKGLVASVFAFGAVFFMAYWLLHGAYPGHPAALIGLIFLLGAVVLAV
jgi:hypothetical protein